MVILVVVYLEQGFLMRLILLPSFIWSVRERVEVAALSLVLFDRVFIDAPHPVVQLHQLHRFSQRALFNDICVLVGRCKGHLVYDLLLHLHREKVCQSIRWHYMVQESNVANHIFEGIAFFETDHVNANSPLVFGLNIDSTLLCLLPVR